MAGDGAKRGELGVGVGGDLVVRSIEEKHERRADDRAEHLGGDVAGDAAPGKLTGGGKAERDGRVEVCPADRSDAPDADEHGHRPTERNHDPARAVALGLVEHHVGDDAVAEQDEQRVR